MASEHAPQNLRAVGNDGQTLRQLDGGRRSDAHLDAGTTRAQPLVMNSHEMPNARAHAAPDRRWLRWGLGVFLAIAFFFLWQEHRAHLLGVLPWLLLLACPLMHLLMHRRHGSHHDAHGASTGETPDEARKGHERGGHGCC